MNKQKLGKRYVRAIILCFLINFFILCGWFLIRIKPLIPRLQHFKEEVFTEEIKKYYESYNDLINDIIESKINLLVFFASNNRPGTNFRNKTIIFISAR